MAYARLAGKDDAHKAAMKSLAALEAKIATNVFIICEGIDKMLKSLTPVYTGQAVRNYIWSRDVPNVFTFPAINNGPTGHTNSMRLGEEPRRAPNEEAAAESLLGIALSSNPFGLIYLSNNSPDIAGLEAGALPGPPLKSRSPNGMFTLTDAYFNTLIAAKGLLK